MRDTTADAGAEPDSGIMWTSGDIWNRTQPILGYDAMPFPSPFTSNTWPSWMQTELTNNAPIHNDPEYRNPLFSTPNYLYVLVSNRGTTSTAGTEQLHMYWAKASTGLAWPGQWVDYVPTPNVGCPSNVLYGIEITKPRRNAASLSPFERLRLANDIVALDSLYHSNAAQTGNDIVSLWDKQDQIHQATHVHCGAAFLPWHRELVNRFEVMLRLVDPTITLPYWDWTTDPAGLFTTGFMGSAQGRADVPFDTLDNGGNFVGSRDQTNAPEDPPQSIERSVTAGAPWTAGDDAAMLGYADYPDMRNDSGSPPGLEALHNNAHGWIGGTLGDPHSSFEDPFVYLVHSETDRLFAKWQRDVTHLDRLKADLVYGNESGTTFNGSASCFGHLGVDGILTDMKPWNGGFTFNGSAVFPWTPAGGYIVTKNAKHASVVSPPYYDDVPLFVPPLAPGESTIVQIPWFPPNPADFAPCFPNDEGHVCLLARVETQSNAPYGMTSPEGSDLGANVANNNNIVWRNVHVVDLVQGSMKTASVIVRNVENAQRNTKLRFNVPLSTGHSFFERGTMTVHLGTVLYEKWVAGGSVAVGLMPIGNASVKIISSGAYLGNIALEADEMHSITTQFQDVGCSPKRSKGCGYSATFNVDVEQLSTVNGTDHLVGGMRYDVRVAPRPPSSCVLEHPRAAKRFTSSLVQAFVPCDEIGGNTSNDTTEGGIPTCNPPATFSQQAGHAATGWSWGAAPPASGTVATAIAVGVPPVDVKITLRLAGVRVGSETGPLADGGLTGQGTFQMMLRATVTDPTNGAMTMIDLPPIARDFTLTGGGITMITTLGALLNATEQPSFPPCTSMELTGVTVLDHNGDAFATLGVWIP